MIEKDINKDYYHVLGVLSEECAEIIQCISKMQRFGIDSCNPVTSITNIEDFNNEYNDLLGTIQMLHSIDPVLYKAMFNVNPKSIDKKEAKVTMMMEVSKKLGRL